MSKVSITLRQARRAAINAQLLDGRTKLPKGKPGSLQLIDDLGYVQIDTLAVINRAHHHTLWTRMPGYQQTMLDELLAGRKTKVFHVKSLHIEPGFKADDEFLQALANKLTQLAEFNDCHSVKLGKLDVRGIKQKLAGMLKSFVG